MQCDSMWVCVACVLALVPVGMECLLAGMCINVAFSMHFWLVMNNESFLWKAGDVELWVKPVMRNLQARHVSSMFLACYMEIVCTNYK